MVESVAALVEINSFSENVEGGRAVGERLRDVFAIDGVASRRIASTRFADHWVFETEGNGAPVALIGHLDTVFPPKTFEGYRRDGELMRGPGVLDMKGGLVIIAEALRAIAAERGFSDLPPLKVVVLSDEELGSPEGQSVIRSEIVGARAALVFEGHPRDAIVTQRKGTGTMRAVAHGIAAHAGIPERGRSAILALARFIDLAHRLNDPARGVSVNVGTITGGQSKNTIPDFAEAWIDLRFATRQDGTATIAALDAAAAEVSRTLDGTRIELSGEIRRQPFERVASGVDLMMRYAVCARASGLGTEEAGLLGGGSDANTTAAMGIPSIDGLGPRGHGFHTRDERIEIACLVPKAQALARFLVDEGGAESAPSRSSGTAERN